jgi:2-polyprenyl-3-methyl-5-hydroxy-6-metoxy-1,4-benzoquinol methylase
VAELRLNCEICGCTTELVGTKMGVWRKQPYHLRRCASCNFTFVENPDTDFDNIYNAAYYAGKGADPLIDYEFEWLNLSTTIRRYEWQGISHLVNQLIPLGSQTSWLDYGCGNGGLVRWVAQKYGCRAYGYDTGFSAELSRSRGLKVLSQDDLAPLAASFDVISAIEVLEHLINPLEVLEEIARLLKPGGWFFYTTGNVRPQRQKILNWSYLVPEIHISFYEPQTMALALQKVGLSPVTSDLNQGYSDIIKYKVLKSFRFKRHKRGLDILPWKLLVPMVDKRYEVSAFPLGKKPD